MIEENNPVRQLIKTEAWRSFLNTSTHPLIINTPLVKCDALARTTGLSEIYFKAEYLQAGNSFKVRGAIHKLQALQHTQEKPTVFTASAGNHGIGLALAARALGFAAVIYVPVTTPDVKKQKILEAGATLEVLGLDFDESEHLAKARCAKEDGVYVSSFDDDFIIAGNGGTIAREIDQALCGVVAGMDLLVPVGGGGIASGLATYFHGSGVRLFGIEPENDCALSASLRAGVFAKDYIGHGSHADGLAGAISQRTYDLCKSGIHTTITVSEAEILNAIKWAYEQMGIAIEGSSAVVIAALLNHKNSFAPRVCLILTGSNIDRSLIAQACAHSQ